MNPDLAHTASLPPTDKRYFEDYEEGCTYACGTFSVDEEEIIAFATNYDPQPMHIDTDVPGGVIASGWHTACLTMRLIAENYLSSVAGLPSPGIDGISWSHPVRPGDRVDVVARVDGSRVSRSKPNRGVLTSTFVARNSEGIAVMTFRATNLIMRRKG